MPTDLEATVLHKSQAIAAELGPEWTADYARVGDDVYPHWVQVTDGDIVLGVHGPGWAGPDRLEINVSLTDAERKAWNSHRDTAPRITVAIDRPAKAAARDIARRIIPEARAFTAKVRDAADQRAAQIAARDATVARVVATIPGAYEAGHNRGDVGQATVYARTIDGIDNVVVAHDGKVLSKVTLNDITVDQLDAIVKVLGGEHVLTVNDEELRLLWLGTETLREANDNDLGDGLDAKVTALVHGAGLAPVPAA